MHRRLNLLIIPILITLSAQSQKKSLPDARPRLVVGIMVDQMRWDFLARYYDRFQPKGGFRRLMDNGYRNEQTFIPYAPTVTACGHATVYTGTVPAVHGIVGNNWWGKAENRVMYCSEDQTVQTVGSNSPSGKMSPKNMFSNSICDELKLATNFRSKVIGIAIKDRGAILPAGHMADAAYWYDNKSGNWITSTYYRESLPEWVRLFNEKKYPDQVYQEGWSTLYPINTYLQSDSDDNDYESRPFGDDQLKFPYKLNQFVGKNYGVISQTPYGNTMTFEMAKGAVVHELLGQDDDPDFLAVSFSSPDYIGHAFGPNSIEVEDAYLRMDLELGAFFNFLDQQVGSNQYVVFLTADHGVAHVPGFLQKHKHPAGTIDDDKIIKELNEAISVKYSLKNVVLSGLNYQLFLNHSVIDSSGVNRSELTSFIMDFMKRQPGIDRVFPCTDLYKELMPDLVRERFSNGFHPKRSGDIQLLFQPGWIDGGKKGTTHGLWNPYDSHIPLLWYGRGIRKGRSNAVVYMTDIAPTLAALLRIQMPNGCIGRPILPVLSEK